MIAGVKLGGLAWTRHFTVPDLASGSCVTLELEEFVRGQWPPCLVGESRESFGGVVSVHLATPDTGGVGDGDYFSAIAMQDLRD